MADWAPVVIGVLLFVLLSPGLVFELPGNHRVAEFGSMRTNGKAIFIHTSSSSPSSPSLSSPSTSTSTPASLLRSLSLSYF
ncbi:hypothetical protein HPP92_025262 [Vanilla planifolia]|uniref:Uncharacterized protein n=1 Tax=Vanilla planifolia TaxID=51239 RepID=A0A835PJM7_VANPL|nr:hypothetical protein HPP92_025262 [Vanilla planifolia]